MKRFFLCLMVVLLATGCRTVTPLDRSTVFYDRASFPEKLQQDTGVLADPILQHGRCHVYLATPGATVTTNARFCTYALTEKQLLVQEWDAANIQYTQFMSVDFAQVVSVDLAFFSRTRQVKLLEPQRLVGISAIIDDGGRVDGEATEKMFQTLKAQGIPSSGDNRLLTRPPEPRSAPVMMMPLFMPTYYHHRHYQHHHFHHRHR